MYENVSAKQGTQDLTKRELNQLVTTDDFTFLSNNEHARAYANLEEHSMRNEMKITCRVAWRFLGVRFGMVERANMINTSKKSVEVVSACLVIHHLLFKTSFLIYNISLSFLMFAIL